MKHTKKNVNKLMRIAAAAGAVASVLAAVTAALGGLVVFKLMRYMDTVQKALPTIEEASRVYLEQHAPDRLPAKGKRRRPA